MNSPTPALKFLSLVCMLLGGAAHAHGLWIEQSGDTKMLRYGEPENAIREKFPGKLENIKAPHAMLLGADGSKATSRVMRAATGFDLGNSSASQSALAMETAMEVKDWTRSGLGIVKPMYYARYAAAPLSAAKPELPLDIVPVAGRGNEFSVIYQGQPVAKAKVSVIAPNTWTQQHTSDEQGRIAINTPWRGQYVLEVTHTDRTPGEFEGRRYESSRHRTMLTFMQSTGEEVKQVAPPRHATE